ncbi:unnamed protein product, partial [marine sediment metagenome]
LKVKKTLFLFIWDRNPLRAATSSLMFCKKY